MMILLTGILALAFDVQHVEASGTIYIKANGSIYPSAANITSLDNVTYTLTGDNNAEIVVERDNIVVDGADYTLQGTGSGMGIRLTYRSNVTIKNTTIANFGWGIVLWFSSNISISDNHIVNNQLGIILQNSSRNNIAWNNITAGHIYGILLTDSSNNTISANNFTNSGLVTSYSYGNVVEDNVVNGRPLVYLEKVSNYTVSDAGQVILVNCTDIRVENLTLSNTNMGIQLWGTTNSSIVGNNLTNNFHGVRIIVSSNNAIIRNNIVNNQHGLWIENSSYNEVYHNNFVNNTIQAVNVGFDYANIWDEGYPSGGNYWCDYTGTDLYHGPYQNETGRDGIGDTPYVVIFGTNRDNYPLMKAWNWPLLGDVNYDFSIDMKDIDIATEAFGTEPEDPLWNSQADLTGPEHQVPDYKVDMRDIGLIARNFGETCP